MLKKAGVNAEIAITDSASFLNTINKAAADSTHDMINMSVGIFTEMRHISCRPSTVVTRFPQVLQPRVLL